MTVLNNSENNAGYIFRMFSMTEIMTLSNMLSEINFRPSQYN
jgi:hypothetical protein